MAKPEWGVKRACLACGTRFYDMQKAPILCPSCGAKFDVETIFRPRRTRAPVEEPKAAKPAKPAAGNGEDLEKELAALADDSAAEDDDDDDDATTIEDTSDLADDDSDVPVVPKDISEEST